MGRSGALSVDGLHAPRRIPLPRRDPLRRHLVYLLQVGRSDLDLEGRQVLVEVLPPLGAEERHDILALRRDPGQRELARAALLPPGDLLHPCDQVEVLLEILALEAGMIAAVVVGLEVLDATVASGEET